MVSFIGPLYRIPGHVLPVDMTLFTPMRFGGPGPHGDDCRGRKKTADLKVDRPLARAPRFRVRLGFEALRQSEATPVACHGLWITSFPNSRNTLDNAIVRVLSSSNDIRSVGEPLEGSRTIETGRRARFMEVTRGHRSPHPIRRSPLSPPGNGKAL